MLPIIFYFLPMLFLLAQTATCPALMFAKDSFTTKSTWFPLLLHSLPLMQESRTFKKGVNFLQKFSPFPNCESQPVSASRTPWSLFTIKFHFNLHIHRIFCLFTPGSLRFRSDRNKRPRWRWCGQPSPFCSCPPLTNDGQTNTHAQPNRSTWKKEAKRQETGGQIRWKSITNRNC